MQILLLALLSSVSATQAAQTPVSDDATEKPFEAGVPLELAPNVKTYGGFRFAESISYDPTRDLFVVVSAGMPQDLVPNDGYVTLVNPDATTHTLKWIGINRNGLTLNQPYGSDIINNLLYVADIDTVRWFDMSSGEPIGSIPVQGVTTFINDIEVHQDGTIYATQTGSEQDSSAWRLLRVTPQGESSVLVSGPPLLQPNGVALDQAGNIVVVNLGTRDVLTFSPDGELIKTEESIDTGNDGLAILADGTKYISSVRQGTVARLRPGQQAELIASGIPNAASMVYDPVRNRLVIPMNNWNAITFVELDEGPESQ